ncbi:hypothetical protein [Natronorubrum texcoconense]|uniref:Uncharacterized protein n=1 Tax=Natronorubrum texcoconense TaxID=1095776 RepID=A0A1G8X0G0_9EURY|nr:hypothetical protein [Natronorubrum texcoconense]SDJ84138.1 hypothetical protein SAMN04515672_1576 [Natronorubrum texcoconense]
MSPGSHSSESHSIRGATDRRGLITFRDEVIAQEPLARAEFDDPIEPEELRIFFSDGIGDATSGRFDVGWTVDGDYNIHYTDDGRDLRWDFHPHDYTAPSDESHFHPPPDASNDDGDVEASCISVSDVEYVARATIKLWRAMYDSGATTDPNGLDDPP